VHITLPNAPFSQCKAVRPWLHELRRHHPSTDASALALLRLARRSNCSATCFETH